MPLMARRGGLQVPQSCEAFLASGALQAFHLRHYRLLRQPAYSGGAADSEQGKAGTNMPADYTCCIFLPCVQ